MLAVTVLLSGFGALLLQRSRAAVRQAESEGRLKDLVRDQEREQEQLRQRNQWLAELKILADTLQTSNEGRSVPQKRLLRRLQRDADRLIDNHSLGEDPIAGPNAVKIAEAIADQHRLVDAINLLERTSIGPMSADTAEMGISNQLFVSNQKPRAMDEQICLESLARQGLELAGIDRNAEVSKQVDVVEHLPTWIRPTVILGMQRLANARADISNEVRLLQLDFQNVSSPGVKSKRGNEFDVSANGTILATGENVPMDEVVITFHSDVPVIDAVRLTAIPHATLPSNGPGLGALGQAAITNISIESRIDTQSPWKTHPIALAVATFQNHDLPFNKKGWNLFDSAGQTNHCVWQLSEPIVKKPDFQPEVRVRLKYQDNEKYGDENLGCFRLSCGSTAPADQDTRTVSLQDVIDHLQLDPWLVNYWAAKASGDVDEMLKLADVPDIDLKPDAYVIDLANCLIENTENDQLKAAIERIEWIPLDPVEVSSSAGSIAKITGDHIITLRDPGSVPIQNELIRFSANLPRKGVVTAIRLETLADPDAPDSGPGRHPEYSREVVIKYISPYRRVSKLKSTQSTFLRITRAINGHKTSPSHDIQNIVNRSKGGEWHLDHLPGHSTASSVFLLAPSDKPERNQFYARFYAGAGAQPAKAVLRRFRIWVTYDSFDDLRQVDQLADQMVQRVLATQSDSDRLLRQYANICASLTPPNLETAVAYAFAGWMTRPENTLALEQFYDLALMRNPPLKDRWLNQAIQIVEASANHDLIAASNNRLFHYFEDRGEEYFRSDPLTAVKSFRQAKQLAPEKFGKHASFGHALIDEARYDEARVVLQEGIDRRYATTWCWMNMARLEEHLGNMNEAIENIERSRKADPNNEYALFYLLRYLRDEKRYAEAVQAHRDYAELVGWSCDLSLSAGLLLGQLGDHSGAIERIQWSQENVLDSHRFSVPACLAMTYLDAGMSTKAREVIRPFANDEQLMLTLIHQFGRYTPVASGYSPRIQSKSNARKAIRLCAEIAPQYGFVWERMCLSELAMGNLGARSTHLIRSFPILLATKVRSLFI